jgi:CheY-like chemotaxis protein
MSKPQRVVLCVDDDPDDRELICYTIGEIDPSIKIAHAEDGVEAISYLSRAKAEAALPCLVILDINMPRMDGKQTLAEMKKDTELKALPVVVFSTSNNPTDKMYCMRNMHYEIKKVLQHCAES